jgi:hypothetical protein
MMANRQVARDIFQLATHATNVVFGRRARAQTVEGNLQRGSSHASRSQRAFTQ